MVLLSPPNFIKLCACAVEVESSQKVIGGMSWSRARGSSLCLLTDDSEVLIPYAIFHRLARLVPDALSDVEQCCIEQK